VLPQDSLRGKKTPSLFDGWKNKALPLFYGNPNTKSCHTINCRKVWQTKNQLAGEVLAPQHYSLCLATPPYGETF